MSETVKGVAAVLQARFVYILAEHRTGGLITQRVPALTVEKLLLIWISESSRVLFIFEISSG